MTKTLLDRLMQIRLLLKSYGVQKHSIGYLQRTIDKGLFLYSPHDVKKPNFEIKDGHYFVYDFVWQIEFTSHTKYGESIRIILPQEYDNNEFELLETTLKDNGYNKNYRT